MFSTATWVGLIGAIPVALFYTITPKVDMHVVITGLLERLVEFNF